MSALGQQKTPRSSLFWSAFLFTGGVLAVGPLCCEARADPTIEIAGAIGAGVVVAGVAPPGSP